MQTSVHFFRKKSKFIRTKDAVESQKRELLIYRVTGQTETSTIDQTVAVLRQKGNVLPLRLGSPITFYSYFGLRRIIHNQHLSLQHGSMEGAR